MGSVRDFEAAAAAAAPEFSSYGQGGDQRHSRAERFKMAARVGRQDSPKQRNRSGAHPTREAPKNNFRKAADHRIQPEGRRTRRGSRGGKQVKERRAFREGGDMQGGADTTREANQNFQVPEVNAVFNDSRT